MFLFGTGHKSMTLKRYPPRKGRFQNMLQTRQSLRSVRSTFGYGQLLKLKVKRFLGLAYQRNGTCLLQSDLSSLIKHHDRHPISTDGGTWYPQACRFLKINHHLHSSYEKSIIERTMQYIKDRTESFDDYCFPCRKKKCKLRHVINWLNLFVDFHNKELKTLK